MLSANTNQTDNSTIEKYCYQNLSSNCDNHGGLYRWSEAMQYSTTEGAQGICPADWHVATDAEWHTLEDGLATGTCDASRNRAWDCEPAGTALKIGGFSGFAGLLSGDVTDVHNFYNLNKTSYFWTSSWNDTYAYNYRLDSDKTTVGRYPNTTNFGYSVRCIQDAVFSSSYSTTQPYYITTSDTSNIDLPENTTQINSATITSSEPANTSIKGMVSFDGKNTWEKWDGSEWSEVETNEYTEDLCTNPNNAIEN